MAIPKEYRDKLKRLNDLEKEHSTLSALVRAMERNSVQVPYDKTYYLNIKKRMGVIENTLALHLSKNGRP